jgi:phosphate transport system permease protein
MKIRKLEESLFKALMIASLAIILMIFAGILFVILLRGVSSLSLSMLIETPKGGYYLGGGGGIANAIVGSLCLAFGASVLSFLIGLPIAFALQKEYLGRRFSHLTRLSLDILWGTPSIVYGAFGFIIMVYMGFGTSLLGGVITLTLLMLPIMVRAMDEVIRMIPSDLKEISYALGTTRLETTLAVVFRQALPGIITGILLAFGRGIGDAASILFTAGYTDYIPRSIFDPVASLPLAVFFQISTPIPEVQGRAYASALVLLIIVLIVSIASRWLSHRSSRHIIK